MARALELLRPIFQIGVASIVLVLSACDQFQDTPKTSPPAPAVVKVAPVVDVDQIGLTEGNIRKSPAISISGDLRPTWIVSGRIRNHSAVDLQSVSVSVRIYSKASTNLMDEAILKVDTNIPAHSVVSLSRNVQLLPPDDAWNWDWAVVKAVPQ